ncbi:MAG: glycine zipper 2TM domain-containing protein [Gammaproteobacteria bacterium]
MNRTSIALVSLLALPAAAWAGHGPEGYREYARVVDVTPLYRTVERSVPRRECYEELERVDYPGRGYGRPGGAGRDSALPTVAGGIIGGVVGRQFGDGRGRDAMTVIGTIIGAAVANDVVRRDEYDPYAAPPGHRKTRYSRARYRTVERCDVAYETHYEQEPNGYLVTYEYEGRTFTTRTRTHPGSRIAVDVELRPVGAG